MKTYEIVFGRRRVVVRVKLARRERSMWLLRRKTAVSAESGEVQLPSTAPVRRIEITVERQTVTRLVRGDGPAAEETAEQQTGLPDTGERR